METLVGELPIAARFFIAFLIVLALIVLTFWAIRRFGGIGLGTAAPRGRQPRLAVIDAAAVDGRRRLVLIRRDNVEHLLMIGGPSDIVVEQNIVRAVPAVSPREATAPREAAPEVAPRASEPAPATREPPSRTAFDGGRIEPAMPRGGELPFLRPEAPSRPDKTARSEPAQPPSPPRVPEAVVRPLAPAETHGRTSDMPVRSAPPLTPAPKPAPEPTVSPQARPAPPASDAELTDMAQRLEAALRRSAAPGPARTEPVFPKPAAVPDAAPRPSPLPFGAPSASREAAKQPPKPEPPRAVPSEAPHPGQPEAKPKSVLDSLEQEMASLLGRPMGKE
jgi:flagellar protein FliO/FliZ